MGYLHRKKRNISEFYSIELDSSSSSSSDDNNIESTQLVVDLSGPSRENKPYNNPRPKLNQKLYKNIFPKQRNKAIKKKRKNEISSYIKLDLQEDKV